MTIGQLESGIMSSAEYSDWIQFAVVEPFGDVRNNIHAGMIASLIASVNRKKGTKAYTYEDFMIMAPDERRKKETNEFVAFLQSAAIKDG